MFDTRMHDEKRMGRERAGFVAGGGGARMWREAEPLADAEAALPGRV